MTSNRMRYDRQTGLWEMPALGGEDVTRQVVTLTVSITPGSVWDECSGMELRPLHETELVGWGGLDGLAVELGLYDDRCGDPNVQAVRRTIAVRASDWERLRDIAQGREGSLAGH